MGRTEIFGKTKDSKGFLEVEPGFRGIGIYIYIDVYRPFLLANLSLSIYVGVKLDEFASTSNRLPKPQGVDLEQVTEYNEGP